MADKGWRGRPLVDDAHAPELESRATIHELSDGLPKHEAEDKAYEGYLSDHMRRAAAHHLAGIRAAHTVGDLGGAAQHSFHYGILADALGFGRMDEPPEDIAALSHDPEHTKIHEFKHHSADAVILSHLQRAGLFKSEDAEQVPFGGTLTEGDRPMWDMSHLLPMLRQQGGERLLIQGAGTSMTAHHVREETGRRIPLASLADSKDGPVALGSPAAGDVAKSAGLAFRVRKAAEMAALAAKMRQVGAVLAASRQPV